MKYMGSKNRHSKELLPIILNDRVDENQYYVEPFVGGFNLIDKVKGNRIANDLNYYLIELFKAIQSGWVPPDFITEDQYRDIRINKEKHDPKLVGFVGFGCSYSGKWFGGYARGTTSKGIPRNFCTESKNNILSQYDGLKGIEMYNTNYYDLVIPENSIIYCDPPYENTTSYKDRFNHAKFWNWCDTMVDLGNKVFVSEYRAPENWECVWEKEVFNTLVQNTGSKVGVERLFIRDETV